MKRFMKQPKDGISGKRNKMLRFSLILLCMITLFIVNKETGKTVKAESTKGYTVKAQSNGTLSCQKKDSKGNIVELKNTYAAIKKSGKTYSITPQSTAGSIIYKFDSSGVGRKYTKEGFVKITYNSSVKNLYVKGGCVYTGWYTKSPYKYYCVKGVRVKGWRKISGKYYYFNSSYQLQKNKIVGSKSAGYYYVDKTGVRITTPEIKSAVAFVVANSSIKTSRQQRLKSCFQALCTYPYQRFYGDKPAASLMPGYAKYMFTNRKGNCYRYGASLAYIARVLGYDSRVAVGAVTAHAVGPLSAHGWCEVLIGSTWKMCDCSMQNAHKDKNLFLVTRKQYPFRLSCSQIFTMNASNGKITWK